MIDREIEEGKLKDEERMRNMLNCGLHLISRAHKIILTDHNFCKNKFLRRQYLVSF